jgi:hypothetical protein
VRVLVTGGAGFGHRPAELFTGVEPTPLSLGLEVTGE